MRWAYTTDSKYIAAYAEKEETRIRQEIAAQVFKGFTEAGFVVTVSHDADNETEREAISERSFLARVFSDADHVTGTVYVFAYPMCERGKWKREQPAHWVRFTMDNVADLICDYTVSAEPLLKKAKESAKRYE